jgi:hypothetical protein
MTREQKAWMHKMKGLGEEIARRIVAGEREWEPDSDTPIYVWDASDSDLIVFIIRKIGAWARGVSEHVVQRRGTEFFSALHRALKPHGWTPSISNKRTGYYGVAVFVRAQVATATV